MRRLFLGLCLMPLLCGSAFADQAAWISKQYADAAVEVLGRQKEFRFFCEPCGDAAPAAPTAITNIALDKVSDDEWEVKVNGLGIDLAYTYVRERGVWVNLALLLDVPVQDVSPLLPEKRAFSFKDDEYVKLLQASPELKAADERLNAAWKAAFALTADKADLQGYQESWLESRSYLLNELMTAHKYHMPLPEGVEDGSNLSLGKAVAHITASRAYILEQYVKSAQGGSASFSGIWQDEDSEMFVRGLALDGDGGFVNLCDSGSDSAGGPPKELGALPKGAHVRLSGKMESLSRLSCSPDLKVEKLPPVQEKERPAGGEKSEQVTVVGTFIMASRSIDEPAPAVSVGPAEYYVYNYDDEGAKDCREDSVEFDAFITVTGTLITPARGLPYFDPKAPFTCARLLPN